MIQTTIRLPDQLYENLKRESQKRGLTMNAYLISVLWNIVGRKQMDRFDGKVNEEV